MIIPLILISLIFFITLLRNKRRGIPLSFFPLSVIYYIVFISVLYYSINVNLDSRFSIEEDLFKAWLGLSYWYSFCILMVGIIYNLSLTNVFVISKFQIDEFCSIEGAQYARLKYFLFCMIALKALLFFAYPAPLDMLIKYGFSEAHNHQRLLHTSSGFSRMFMGHFHVIGAALALLVAVFSRSKMISLIMLLVSIFFAGWYFSKSMMLVPLVAYFIIKRMRIRYAIPLIFVGIIAVFALRLDSSELDYIWGHLLHRLFTETGYSLVHFSLISAEGAPRGFESRYFFGFNTMFGISPRIDWSREAYSIVTGRYGATSSGYAPVSLYAFFGWGALIAIPLLISLVALLDHYVFRLAAKNKIIYLLYLFFSLLLINSMTVDVFRVWSPIYLFSSSVWNYLAFCVLIYLVVRTRLLGRAALNSTSGR